MLAAQTLSKIIYNADFFFNVKMQPYYLPRELSCVFVAAVYISPDANNNNKKSTAVLFLLFSIEGLQLHFVGQPCVVQWQ